MHILLVAEQLVMFWKKTWGGDVLTSFNPRLFDKLWTPSYYYVYQINQLIFLLVTPIQLTGFVLI